MQALWLRWTNNDDASQNVIINMNVRDNVCLIIVIMQSQKNFQVKVENPETFDKLSWDSSRCEELLHKLEDKRYLFEEISNSVSNDSIGQIVLYKQISFEPCFGKKKYFPCAKT